MTAPASRPVPAPIAEGWQVEIPMPIGRGGKPVGWLSLNDRSHWSKKYRVAKAWRKAAYEAYMRHRLPRGLDHVYVEVEFRFKVRRHRDPSNFEGTAKPVIDALQPYKTTIIKDKTTGRPKVRNGKYETKEEPGWGVVPGDDPRYITRGPEMPIGEPLGHNHGADGVVIIHIKPIPLKTSA